MACVAFLPYNLITYQRLLDLNYLVFRSKHFNTMSTYYLQ